MSKDANKDFVYTLPYRVEYQEADESWTPYITFLTEAEAQSFIINVNPKLRPIRIIYNEVAIVTLLV